MDVPYHTRESVGSPTRDRTRTAALEAPGLNPGTAREVLGCLFSIPLLPALIFIIYTQT